MEAATNGEHVLRIGRKGCVKIAFGDEAAFSIDVIETSNQWLQVEQQFRDADNKVPLAELVAMNNRAWEFVRDLAGHKGYSAEAVQAITLAESLEFMKIVTEESQRLSGFFTVKSVKEEPSSPEPTTTLRFST
jgi:hypothetical protein